MISSGAQRCLATVAPYAALAGAVLETEPALTIGGTTAGPDGPGWTATDAAGRWITGVATAAEPTVICAHRQNLGWLLDQACAALGAPSPSGAPLRKGAFWVLQVSAGQLVSAEQHQAGLS